MRLDELIPTHNYLRQPQSVLSILDELRKETFLSKELCIIYKIGNRHFIGNGHHRLKSAYLCGFSDIEDLPWSCTIKEFKLSDFMSINFTLNYVTPYNPILQCRKAEFFTFKNKV